MQPLDVGVVIADTFLYEQVLAGLRKIPARILFRNLSAEATLSPERDIRAFHPDVVLLQVPHEPEGAAGVLRRVRSLPSAPMVIALAAAADAETILAAIRAGACDCLFPPVDEPVLRQALDRIATARAREESQRLNAKVIALLSATGGCGATTIAAHMAAELRRTGAGEILLADFDLVTGLAGFWTKAKHGYSIADAVRSIDRLDQSFWKALVSNVQPHLDVIGAPAEPLLDETVPPEALARVLRFARAHYDWILADLGQGVTPASAGLIAEASLLFVVTSPELPALYQARRAIRALDGVGSGRDSLKLILSRVRKQHLLTSDELEKLLLVPVAAVIPEELAEIQEAQEEGRLASPKSGFGQRISQLVAKIAEQPQAEKARPKYSLFRSLLSAQP